VGVAAALDEGIEDLEEMMEELRVEKESGRRAMSGTRELQRSHGRNFDRQASSLRRRLEKMPPAGHSDDDDRVHSANTSDVMHRSGY